MQKISQIHKLQPLTRLLEVNIGDASVLSNILSQNKAIVKKKLTNCLLFSLQDLLLLAGMLEIDLYTLISIIIQNPSFMYAHKQDIGKYFEYIQKEIEVAELKESVTVSNKFSCWTLLDVNYKEDSILKIFNKEIV